jgi:GNAT superfamily N-acetyltransferase
MTWFIREVTARDDLDSLLAGTINWPGAERVRAIFAVARDTDSRQLVAEADSKLLAYCHCLTAPVAEGGRAGVHVFVDLSTRGQGVGSRLWQAALGIARGAGLPGVQTAADLDDQRSLSIAVAHDLIRGTVRQESRLDLALVSSEAMHVAITRASEAGVQFVPFDPANEQAWRLLYGDFLPLHHSAPDSVAGREPPRYETWRSGFSEPWQILLARRGGTTVGMTMAFARKDLPSRVVTYFTGVAAGERGQGIATALKAQHACLLKDSGWQELSTWNMESNLPILSANAKLGFVPITRTVALSFDF